MSGCRISRAFGPQSPRQAKREVTSSTVTEPSSGACDAIQARSWRPNAVPGDDPEAVFGEPGDGEVALDPAAAVQHLRVGDCADLARDPVVAEALEEVGGARAGHLDLRERRLVEERGGLADGAVLRLDRGRPVAPGPAPGPQRLVAAGRVRLEPVRALPARLLAERRRRAPAAARRRARAGAACLPAARGRGTSRRSRWSRPRPCGRACTRGSRSGAPKRRESISQTSRLGSPSTIHSATSLPIPPAPARPCAQKPAATQKPRTSVGPRMNSPSGVKASGPLTRRTTSASASVGHADDRVLHQLLEALPVLLEQLAVEVAAGSRRGPTARGCARSRP